MKSKKAIVIDDESSICELLKMVLDEKGYAAEIYPNPLACPLYRESSEACHADYSGYDILITDYNMPGMNGIDFVSWLLQNNWLIPKIAIISGTWDIEAKTRASGLNCQLFDKPFSINEVQNWIDS